MKTVGEQCVDLSRRLGDRANDREALNRELRRMGAEQRLAAQEQKQWQRWVTA